MNRALFIAMMLASSSPAEENLNAVPADLTVPKTEATSPAAGKRVRFEGLHHRLYLPTDWTAGRKWPVIVEYPGNGGYKNALGDTSEGTAEGCMMGYGLSAGRGFIWISMPFLNADGSEAIKWWGDLEKTKRYCIDTLKMVCREFGGDERRVVLMGFSRGAIACNYIGLNDDEIAPLWCGMFCHSHYDGVHQNWGYAGADRASALLRLKRLDGRPQWISHEKTVVSAQAWLRSTGLSGDWTFEPLPYPNHSARWALCDVEFRLKARRWLLEVCDMNK